MLCDLLENNWKHPVLAAMMLGESVTEEKGIVAES